MRFYLDYGTGIVVSFVLHGAIISAMYLNWNPESSRIIIQPDYIRAELVQLNSKRTKTDHLMQSKSVQKRVDDRRRLAEKNKAMQAAKRKRRGQGTAHGASRAHPSTGHEASAQ